LALPADLGCLYVKSGDLYYNNGSGTPIQITIGAGLNASSIGGIGGDYITSGASVFYTAVGTTYSFTQAANQTATLSGGPYIFHPNTVGAFGITMQAPLALGADYLLTLPSGLPASQKIVTIDVSGNIGVSYDFDNSTIEVVGNVIRVKDSGITSAKILNDAVITSKILDLNVTAAKLVANIALVGNCSSVGNFTVGDAVSDSLFIGSGAGAQLRQNSAYGGTCLELLSTSGVFSPAGVANAGLKAISPIAIGIIDPGGGFTNFAIMVTSTTDALRTVRGAVTAAGAIGGGEGFTSVRTGLGQFTVSFSPVFAGIAQCTVTAKGGINSAAVMNGSATAGQMFVHTFTASTGAASDHAFDFHAIGPR
jgi:hypothetical protein